MREILLNSAKSEYIQSDNSPFSGFLEVKSNFITPDIETVEIVNDSKYFQRIEVLWGDLAAWV